MFYRPERNFWRRITGSYSTHLSFNWHRSRRLGCYRVTARRSRSGGSRRSHRRRPRDRLLHLSQTVGQEIHAEVFSRLGILSRRTRRAFSVLVPSVVAGSRSGAYQPSRNRPDNQPDPSSGLSHRIQGVSRLQASPLDAILGWTFRYVNGRVHTRLGQDGAVAVAAGLRNPRPAALKR